MRQDATSTFIRQDAVPTIKRQDVASTLLLLSFLPRVLPSQCRPLSPQIRGREDGITMGIIRRRVAARFNAKWHSSYRKCFGKNAE